PLRRQVGANGVDMARYFIADHTRGLRCIRIQALPGQDVSEVDAAGMHADAQFSCAGLRIGRIAQLQRAWAAVTADEDLSHGLPTSPEAPQSRRGRGEFSDAPASPVM